MVWFFVMVVGGLVVLEWWSSGWVGYFLEWNFEWIRVCPKINPPPESCQLWSPGRVTLPLPLFAVLPLWAKLINEIVFTHTHTHCSTLTI